MIHCVKRSGIGNTATFLKNSEIQRSRTKEVECSELKALVAKLFSLAAECGDLCVFFIHWEQVKKDAVAQKIMVCGHDEALYYRLLACKNC